MCGVTVRSAQNLAPTGQSFSRRYVFCDSIFAPSTEILKKPLDRGHFVVSIASVWPVGQISGSGMYESILVIADGEDDAQQSG